MCAPFAIAVAIFIVAALFPGAHVRAMAEVIVADRSQMDECLALSRQRGERQEVCIGRIQDACLRTGGREEDCAAHETGYWDELLNRSYSEARAAGPTERREALRTLQRQWLSWRDARCSFAARYGQTQTSAEAARASCLAEETARRAIELTLLTTVSPARPEGYDYPVVVNGQVPASTNQPAAQAGNTPPQVTARPSQQVAGASGQDTGVLLYAPPAWFGSFSSAPEETLSQPAPLTPVAPAPPPAPEVALAPQPEEQAPPPPEMEIKVIIDNVQADLGTVVVALCDKDISQEGCPYHKLVSASVGSVSTAFVDAPPGRYAVGAFHDVNENGDLDRSGMIPQEPVALSNHALDKGLIPSFDDAALDFSKGSTTVTLTLKRWGE